VTSPGWVELTATHPSYMQAQAWMQAGGEPGEIEMVPGAPLTVAVLRPDRTPAAGARVGCSWIEQATWEDAHGKTHTWDWERELDPVTAGDDGRASLGAFDTRTLVVWAETAAFARAGREVEITGKDPVQVELVLREGGVIEGTVRDRAGDPIHDARVHPRGDDLRVVTTDEAGRYRLPAVGPGQVHIVAEGDAYAPAEFGSTLGWGRSVPVPVDAGEVVTGIDFVLGPGTVIEGRVVDPDGRPLAGMHANATLEYQMLGTPATDDGGSFRIGPLAIDEPTPLSVTVAGRGYAGEQRKCDPLQPGETRRLEDFVMRPLAAIEGRVVDGGGAPATEGTVSLNPGPEAATIQPDGTFTLYGARAKGASLVAFANEPYRQSRPYPYEPDGDPDAAIVLVLESTYSIAGVVQTPEGQPRPGISLLIRSKGSGSDLDRQEVTDADGRFSTDGLLSGTWLVGFSDWKEVDGTWTQGFEEGKEPVEVEAGNEDMLLTLPFAGGWVTGRVVRKVDLQPVKEFGVAIYKYTFFVPSWEDSDRFEDEQGRFRLELAEEGTYAIDLHADGLASVRSDKFSLKKGETVDVGTIALGAGGRIEGVVHDALNDPVQWARIYVLNSKLQTNDDAPWTDRHGRYTMDGITPGVYQLFAVSPTHPLALVKGVEVGEDKTTRVPVTFGRSAPLTLHVVDEQGAPVEGAKLVWSFPALAPFNSSHFGSYEPPGFGSNDSDAEGRIEKPFLPAGPVTWVVTAEGFAPSNGQVTLEPGVPRTVEVRIERTGPR